LVDLQTGNGRLSDRAGIVVGLLIVGVHAHPTYSGFHDALLQQLDRLRKAVSALWRKLWRHTMFCLATLVMYR